MYVIYIPRIKYNSINIMKNVLQTIFQLSCKFNLIK